jgi:hypothetical protein
LPRHRLQLDRSELGDARQRRDKHRERKHTGLEPDNAYLLELVPRHGEMGRKHDSSTDAGSCTNASPCTDAGSCTNADND